MEVKGTGHATIGVQISHNDKDLDLAMPEIFQLQNDIDDITMGGASSQVPAAAQQVEKSSVIGGDASAENTLLDGVLSPMLATKLLVS